MIRTLVAVAAVAAALGAVPAQAARNLPVELVAEPGSCRQGYHDIGYVGLEGTRWRICQQHPIDPR